ncbi:MAG: hypothetical protein UX71_C0013G0002 [Parcubacteria group bacterium GW2011_GWA1_47_10]|nr:MAG: hypothetical protein UX71_C0013G0002 [Parcubacteria group bacterium GW2011_GWA1_47_10]KKU97554.1 MAG: hypothetical protein UY30_C0003G0009 [Parcubacteria group bacterium GW2011_GWB1_48_6]
MKYRILKLRVQQFRQRMFLLLQIARLIFRANQKTDFLFEPKRWCETDASLRFNSFSSSDLLWVVNKVRRSKGGILYIAIEQVPGRGW